MRWDLASGKVTSDFPVPMTINPGPNSHHAVIESCGPNHVLLDGRILVDLEKRSHIWSYYGPNVSTGGPDGRHWYVAGANNQNAAVTPLALPEENVNRVVAMVNDPASKPSLRVGMQATVPLEMSGPPKDNEAFQQGDHRQPERQAQGQRHDPGPGRPGLVHRSRRGEGHRPQGRLPRVWRQPFLQPAGSIAITNLVCDVQFADSQGRIPLAPQQTFGLLQGFRRIYRLPPGETLESYLKNNQWNGVKMFVGGIGLPYFVARQPDGVVMLPGSSDLNAVK